MQLSCQSSWGDACAVAAGNAVLILQPMEELRSPQTVDINNPPQGVTRVLNDRPGLLTSIALSPRLGYVAIGSEDGKVGGLDLFRIESNSSGG